MDDNQIDLSELDQVESSVEQNYKVKERFGKLSEKLTLTAREKDEAEAKVKTEADARLKAEKERDFYRGFSQVSSKYPAATEYQDQILEKVNGGYTLEDAAVSILAKEGKFGGTNQPVAEFRPDNPAGGSATTAMSDTGQKSVEEMSREEVRAELMEREKRGENLMKLG